MSDDTIIREVEGGFGPKIDTGVPVRRAIDSLRGDAEGYEALFRVQQEAQNSSPAPSASPLAVLNGEPDRSPQERDELARQRYAESLTETVTREETPPEVVSLSPAPIEVFRRDLTDDEKQRVEDHRNRENVQRLEAENAKAHEANDSATGAQEQ